MIYETVDLYAANGQARGSYQKGFLHTYIPHSTEELLPKTRPAVLICPGGGYEFCSEREAEPLAIRFMTAGYAAFVLDYEVYTPYPAPLMQACMAIKYIRENAVRFGVDPAHIAVMGFSAGGHLACSLATLYEEGAKPLGVSSETLRPDAAVLCYPVISSREGILHEGTIGVISGGDPALREKLSLERRVTKDTPPAFIWHTQMDDCVLVENSLALASAYRKAGVPFELHIFENGRHGLSLANHETGNTGDANYVKPEIAVWVDLALAWLKNRGFAVVSLPAKQ